MRGVEAIIAARLGGYPLARIDVDVLTARKDSRARWQHPGVEVLRDVAVGRIEVYADDNPATLDLRCCHGLPVLVLAESYETGWPVASRAAEYAPLSVSFASPDCAASYTTEGLQAWEL